MNELPVSMCGFGDPLKIRRNWNEETEIRLWKIILYNGGLKYEYFFTQLKHVLINMQGVYLTRA